MTSTRAALVERVSREVAHYVGVDLDDTLEGPRVERAALAAIRAVLLGVREPSEGMGYEGAMEIDGFGYTTARRVFTAMIDALLAEIGG